MPPPSKKMEHSKPSALRRGAQQGTPEEIAAKRAAAEAEYKRLNEQHQALFDKIKSSPSRKEKLQQAKITPLQDQGGEQERRGFTLAFEHFNFNFYAFKSGSFSATVNTQPNNPNDKEAKLTDDQKLNLGLDEWAKVAVEVVEDSGGSKNKFFLDSVTPPEKADYLIGQLKKCGFKEVVYKDKSHSADEGVRPAEVTFDPEDEEEVEERRSSLGPG